jgi:hypothetical protein
MLEDAEVEKVDEFNLSYGCEAHAVSEKSWKCCLNIFKIIHKQVFN